MATYEHELRHDLARTVWVDGCSYLDRRGMHDLVIGGGAAADRVTLRA